MPAGVSWPQYITFLSGAMIFAIAGAQSVHHYYKPLADVEQLVEEEFQKRRQRRDNS